MTKNYIAYLDLLGVKDLAKFYFHRYYKALISLQINILKNLSIPEYKDKINIKFFSDCLFAESSDLKCLIEYIKSIRDTAISNKYYFKASISEGYLLSSSDADSTERIIQNLTALPHDTSHDEIRRNYTEIRALLDSLGKAAEGVAFLSPDVCAVYEKENTFKGVGVFVDYDLVEKNKKFKELFVPSFYIPNINTQKPILYYDLKFDNKKMSKLELNSIFQDITMATLGAKAIGVKYISLLATYVNSTSYDFSIVNKDDKFTSSVIIDLFANLKKTHPKLFTNLIGLHYIYLLILNNTYAAQKYDEATALVDRFRKASSIISRFEGKFDTIPNEVMHVRYIQNLKKDYHMSIMKDMDNA